MRIQCTKKVLERLHLEEKQSNPVKKMETVDSLFSWHANIITADRHKILIFVNNSTRLVIICYRPKADTYRHIGITLEEGIKELFEKLGIRSNVTNYYLKNADVPEITITGTRSEIARMNKIADEVLWQSRFFREDRMFQTTASLAIASFPVSAGKDYFLPKEKLYQELCRISQKPENAWNQVRNSRSYVLRIALTLNHYSIFRKIEIPIQATFYQLHQAIQQSFGWHDSHLHMFAIYGKDISKQKNHLIGWLKPQAVVLDSDDPEADMYYDPEEQKIYFDRSLLLSDIFAACDACVYTYDFGDNWEHLITVEKRIEENGNTHCRLLERQGKCPPEDVGGEPGFEEYMRIISNPADPEYEETVQWAKSTSEEEKSVEEINQRLSWID